MKSISAFILLVLVASFPVFSAGSAAANCERWKASSSGGTFQASVCAGDGSFISVTCALRRTDFPEDKLSYVTEDGVYVSVDIDFGIAGAKSPENKIILNFDDREPMEFQIKDGGISNMFDDCPSCMLNYNKIINLFREHKYVTVRTVDGKSTTFTLRGAAKTIPDCVYRLKQGEAP